MSFMFNPTDYADPHAVNILPPNGIETRLSVSGNPATARELLRCPARTIGLDGYTTAPFETLRRELEKEAQSLELTLEWVDMAELLRDAGEITAELLEHNLPNDRQKDPVLLYGHLYEGEYEDLMLPASLAKLQARLTASVSDRKRLIVYGYGALCQSLCALYDLRVWIDVIPLRED